MKMYKRIFGVLLCLCMLLGAVSLAGATEDGGTTEGGQTEEGTTGGNQTHENHPICGKEHKNIGDHKGECPNLEWTKLYMDEDGKLCYGDGTEVTQESKSYMLGEGAYYLSDNVVVSNTIKITGNVSLCLNGKTLSFSTNSNAFPNDDSYQRGGLLWITNGKTLSICDCGNNGSVELSRVDSGGGAKYSTVYSADNSTLNLYGGAIKRTNDSTQGAAITLARVGAATFNMYGGTISNTSTNYFADAVSVYQIQMGEDETCAINIYDGSVESVRGGIDTTEGEKIEVLIAGGSIICNGTSGYAVNVSSGTALILSGSPTLKGSDADIYLPANSHFTVTDDFDPTTKVSVAKSDHGVFAKPAASGSSLAEKTNYFVSTETGYCVTTSGNDLQLTPCEITTQPTATNNYTVAANGSPTYQWYRITQGDVPVTDKNATDKGNYYWDGEWSIEDRNSAYISDQSIFSIYMKKDYTLKLSCEDSFQGSITEVNLYNSSNEEVGEKETVRGTSGETIYEFTAPADGAYTLKLSARGFSMGETERTSLSFTATATGDVPNTEQQPVSTGATLDTSKLCKGPYICRVTWQGKTDKGTTIIDSDPVTLNNSHTAAAATRENENPATCTADGSYDEVVKCSRCGTEISRTSKTIPALGHDYGEWTVTKEATTTAEGEKQRVCSNDNSHIEKQSIPKLTLRYYYNSTTTTTKDTTKKDNTKSPGTFDPGVGVYALTAVLSVTGMAWVGRKKH